uniref:acylaminoacyl-peptidase n=1 Tax=Chromera velia CCMP2878 TaxID=1169474 RepID=A0A0G4GVC0_9ALVE|eukprot:Cvel_23500.t1-p1 / transcript=Cvel_23500.t1 / gene=Cvel_23500 / organism=Chromera_velia_CCMP2878 / gene_product=Acylamino-acid-releasing enzyme, putative / transcript_product=Acylamino-acid-releasing enzyme, putative / location=Cvel_scaffold2428:545-9001(+) / protein_length=811 / sequence_SO=supercontig / SO=protein_coding / is_pseudo=false
MGDESARFLKLYRLCTEAVAPIDSARVFPDGTVQYTCTQTCDLKKVKWAHTPTGTGPSTSLPPDALTVHSSDGSFSVVLANALKDKDAGAPGATPLPSQPKAGTLTVHAKSGLVLRRVDLSKVSRGGDGSSEKEKEKGKPGGSIHAQFTPRLYGGASLDPAGRLLVYAAERARPVTSAFSEGNGKGKEDTLVGGQFDSDLGGGGADWGEQLVGFATGRLFVANLGASESSEEKFVEEVKVKMETVGKEGETWSFERPSWVSTGKDEGGVEGLVCCARATSPWRLGLIYCMNRRSKILFIPWGGSEGSPDEERSAVTVSEESTDWAAWSPVVFRRDGKVFCVYLSVDSGENRKPHHACSRVVERELIPPSASSQEWTVGARRVVVDIFGSAEDPEGGGKGSDGETSKYGKESRGVYSESLPERCVSADGRFLFLNSASGPFPVVLCVNLLSGTVSVCPSPALKNGGKRGASELLDLCADGGTALVTSHSPSSPPTLHIVKLEELTKANQDEEAKPEKSFDPSGVPLELQDLAPDRKRATEIFESLEWSQWGRHWFLKPSDRTFELSGVSSTAEKGKGPLPVLFWIHGGPHGSTPVGFSSVLAFLASAGFCVLSVNFRGSRGYGQRELLSLLGKAGRQDVDDCTRCLKLFLEEKGSEVDGSRAVVTGGSHGGFLTLHLIGQHPELFKAASVRNPVASISSMIGVSDIPDWVFAEASNEEFDFQVPTETNVLQFRRASPLQYVHQVKTPLIVAIGQRDIRVPPSNGRDYFQYMRAQTKTACRLLTYPDNDHPIANPDASLDYWMNSLCWFNRYL